MHPCFLPFLFGGEGGLTLNYYRNSIFVSSKYIYILRQQLREYILPETRSPMISTQALCPHQISLQLHCVDTCH